MHISVRTRATIDVPKMLTLIAKARKSANRNVREWWSRVAVSGPSLVHCLVCDTLIEGAQARAIGAPKEFDRQLDEHIELHRPDAQSMIDADIWPARRKTFDRWCDQAGDVPHELRFGVPCVRWVIIRILNLATLPLIPVETLQAAMKRAVEDPTFCDALDAAADVPSGITTLLEQQF